jgi:hypothetical protein
VKRTCPVLVLALIVAHPLFGAIAIDANVSKDQGSPSTTVSTPVFSTTTGNELLLAFISADKVSSSSTTVMNVAGAGLTWVLVERTNVQAGTAEIWRAFATSPLSAVTVTATISQRVASSLTVMSFTSVDTSGTNGLGAIGAIGTGNANPGAPAAKLVTTRNGSLVLGVGNDWDNAIARTLGAGQSLIHQDFAPVGDTYWVQMQSSPILLSGTSVTMNDTAPTGDRYNFSIVEVLAAAGGGTTGTITGTISQTGTISGATVQLLLGSTQIATANVGTNGSYTFSSVANGTYMLQPSESGFTFSPTTQSATVNGNTVTVSAFTATATTGTITGSITQTGTISGATVQLLQGSTQIAAANVGTNGSYTFSNVANGTYTLQPSEAGFTFSPAMQNVTVNGNTVTAQTFTATAATGTITGSISQTGTISGATVQLLQGSTQITTATVGTNGSYTFSNVANGTYTLQPSESGFTFSPATQSATVNGNTVTAPVFTATAPTGTINGSISQAGTISGATVQLLQGSTQITTATVGTNGSYTFSNVANGTYTLQPNESGFTFSPTTETITVNGNSVAAPAFTATAAGAGWGISGVISPSLIGGGTLVTLSGAAGGTATADTGGNYSFANLANGTYTLTTSKTGTAFTPLYQSVTINGANVTASLFTAESINGQIEYPNLSDIIPTGAISIVGTGSSRVFQYTHDTYNGGPGPLVILPVYNPASGTYEGTQNIYSLNASGNWTLTQSIRIAGSFVFDAAHGHFHFPFTTYGLYTVAADGNPGTPVATSGKISFCINDSFIYNSSLPNAGALGNLGSCSDPTSLRGLDIGAVDEYDQTDEGQSISIAGVPDGTYWLKAVVDPDNYLAESDKTNNETDVKISIVGNTVQVLQTVVPVLPPPPVISVTSPLDGTSVTGTVQLAASTATTTGVQFLIDGEPLGTSISAAPYSMTWDTTTAPNGTHWLAAQTISATGRIGTSAVVAVTVSNSTTAPPAVQITTPNAGATVSATLTVAANAASSQGLSSVTFYVDGAQIGTPITAPPYLTTWDSETATAGQHALTATAIDITGNSGTSAPVTVTVDNSHPPNQVGEDAVVSVDGVGLMTAPVITTSQNGELLVAFVSYDGPSNSPQTATVTSSSLIWRLVKRSNHQAGTAEIWMAYASDSPETFSVTAQSGVGTTYHGSLTVIAFTNASGPGIVNQTSAPSGAPDIYLPGVSSGNWVFAVGNDWDNAIARTPVSGQVLVHQRVDTQVGDTYWVQSMAAPAAGSALVDIHDSAPISDQWNYAAVEIVATRQ